MTNEDVLREFREAGALREGHFVLSSGLHSPMFLQKNLVFMHPERTERLCRALAALIVERVGDVDVCVSPAVGGIIPGYETARALGVPSIYVEREAGVLTFRRGFELAPGARVAMVEDVVSTGLSSRECVAAIRAAGGVVVCAACLVDRSGGRAETGAPTVALATLDVPAYPADALPPELAAIPEQDPGQPQARGVSRLRLGVNIDHVATIRNARGETYPDPARAAELALIAGADGVTAHLREDRRHISDGDIDTLAALTRKRGLPLNLEMAATAEMEAIALAHRPHAACIVPERREEVTTEGGLDVAGQHNRLAPVVSALKGAGIRVSLFIEPEPAQVTAARDIGADVVELHCGAWCEAVRERSGEADALLARLADAASLAHGLGLEVHAGHGIDYETVGPIAAIPELAELNIGHFLVGEAIFVGLEAAIRRMRRLMDQAREAAAQAGRGRRLILGIGSDLTDIRRIADTLDRFGERFVQRVFTDLERARSERKSDRAASYAKRFAAKEACAKALGTGLRRGVFWRDMGVANLRSGQPTMILTGGAAARLAEMTPAGLEARVHLSLTDDHPYAQAFVIIEAV